MKKNLKLDKACADSKRYYFIMDTQIGLLIVQASDIGLTGVWFMDGQVNQAQSICLEEITAKEKAFGEKTLNHPILMEAKKQLEAYFLGKQKQFQLPLDVEGTLFQSKVWQALTFIPSGEVVSYQWVANKIENPKAVRAVGLANSKNPISIIVPCHRVIGKNGQLTGYAGGIERKKWLLEHEQKFYSK